MIVFLRPIVGHLSLIGTILFFLTGCVPQKSPSLEDSIDFPKASPVEVLPATEIHDNLNSSPKWRVGDQWLWSDGYGLQVTEVSGEITTLERTDRRVKSLPIWEKRKGLFKIESHSGKVHRRLLFRSKDPMSLFPLKPKKHVVFKREYLADGVLRVHQTSWTVEKKETIETPAGMFDCIIMVMRTRSVLSDWVGFERWWYSPKVRHYVRLEYKYGTAPASSRVLISYSLADTTKGP